jgi:hypothetical protein
VIAKPNVTAGLKCPPEMWPTAEGHHGDHEPVGKGDPDELPTRDDDRADADEHERERPDELCERSAEPVGRHLRAKAKKRLGRPLLA